MNNKTIVNVASYPPRKEGLKRRIAELYKQCDVLNLYLNGYSELPSDIELPDNANCIYGDDIQHPNLGSQGKLYWIDKPIAKTGYYLTVDDDIYYPSDYVSNIVERCLLYRNLAIVGFHGSLFRINDGDPAPKSKECIGARLMFCYNRYLKHDTSVHMLGNGTMCCHPSTLQINNSPITGLFGSGDDEDMGVYAQQHSIPMIALRHSRNWIVADRVVNNITPSYQNKEFLRLQNEKLCNHPCWRLFPKPDLVVSKYEYKIFCS